MLSRYVANGLERARYQLLDDGTFAATVPALRGVVATGPTLEACRRDLAEVIEAWVLVRVSRGLNVPAIGGATVKVRRAS
jgi:predicted RNase H-like HicB family nuclease